MPDEPLAVCPHFRLGHVPVTGFGGPAQALVPLAVCDLGAFVIEADRAARIWLAYGPDGGLVCRERCTLERLNSSCDPARPREPAEAPEPGGQARPAQRRGGRASRTPPIQPR